MLLISLDSLGIRLADIGSWEVAFWLGLFTAVAMFTLVPIRTRRSVLAEAREGGLPLGASTLLQAGSLTFFVLAVTITTVANTVIIIAAVPVVAALIAHVAIGEKTTLRTWVAIAVSIAGIWTVVSGSLGSGRIEGDLLAVAAIVSFGSNLTLWRRYPEINRMVVVGLGSLTMALVAVIPADPLDVDTRALVVIAVLGLVTGPAGRVSVATSTNYIPVAQAGLFAPVETVAAIAWAWLFLNEEPETSTIVGGVIVILAVLYGTMRREAPAPVDPLL